MVAGSAPRPMIRAKNALKIRFSTSLGKEPEVELRLVYLRSMKWHQRNPLHEDMVPPL
jgi:hypothetical protein